MADRGNLSSNASQASPPHPMSATLRAKGTPNITNKSNPGTLLGVGRMAEKDRGCQTTLQACTVSLTVPSNLDHPALPETNTPTDRHVGTCFHRNLSVLWTTLCKNYSVFLNLDNQNS